MTKEKQTRFTEIAQKHGDPWIWGIYITLLIISVIESYSASSQEVVKAGIYGPIIKQCVFLAIGAVIVFFLHRIDYNKSQFLYMMIPGLALFSLFCMVYVILFGKVINDAQRTIIITSGLTIQPSELAKLSIVTLLAYILAKSQKNRDISRGGLIAAAVAVMVYCGLNVSSGLTNTLLLICISFSMLLIGGASMKKIIALMAFFGIVVGLAFMVKHSNESKEEAFEAAKAEMVDTSSSGAREGVSSEAQQGSSDKKVLRRFGTWSSRVHEWWNRDSLVYLPISDKNQQEMFSCMAQAHGGLFGVGPGRSRECSRLPLAFSDYIFSIIIEETGMVGGIFVMILYLWLLARAAMIVRRSKRVLPSLLIIGMASLITYQALFHMAINVGVFPVSGQPLPLISKGGTSIMTISVAFGVMLSVSRTIANYNNKNNKNEAETLPEGLDAENPTQILPKNMWTS